MVGLGGLRWTRGWACSPSSGVKCAARAVCDGMRERKKCKKRCLGI